MSNVTSPGKAMTNYVTQHNRRTFLHKGLRYISCFVSIWYL